jgi:uncharacterized membrane protein YphA (DoxX/SURF4 family)
MNVMDTLQTTRGTRDDRAAAGIRIALGVLFVMTGVMKLAVPTLGAAFAGQLAGAGIPFQELNRWVVPFLEIAVGGVLLVGYYTRIATLLVYNIMIVATYVHVVVDDPSLFPLQPEEPIIPVVVMVLAAYLLLRGGGSGSLDLKEAGGSLPKIPAT